MQVKTIKKILIANRGEIAIRIIKTARKMGIATVTIFTEEEKHLPHAMMGDEWHLLGDGTLQETYLNEELILSIAKKYAVDAIHPGYGFLSERALFAEKVIAANIIFIGPRVENIALMGDKLSSKEAILKWNIPSIPGYHGKDQALDVMKKEACKMGFPVLLKASAGGGGKGMRVVYREEEFQKAYEEAKREGLASFKDDTLILEKYLESPRHIEVQVLSDQHGHHFHLFERECSIQRRYQKIIEEAPSPALSENLRQKMTDAAIKITREMNYLGAGTIEFILEQDLKNGIEQFYFLEMNTRLQVEHPITEKITGLDLVEWQIRIARGEALNFKQSDLKILGHAIEVRLYAEDPDHHFLPSIGKIDYLGELSSSHKSSYSSSNSSLELSPARLDTGYLENHAVGVSFDPMLAKLIVHGRDRLSAISLMREQLSSVFFHGEKLKTNRHYLRRIFNHPAFIKGETFTHFVKTHADDLKIPMLSREEKFFTAGLFSGLKLYALESARAFRSLQAPVYFKVHSLLEDSALFNLPMELYIQQIERMVIDQKSELTFQLAVKTEETGMLHFETARLIKMGERIFAFHFLNRRTMVRLLSDSKESAFFSFELASDQGPKEIVEHLAHFHKSSNKNELSKGAMLSPMPGKILKILKDQGTQVVAGEAVLIMQAMKMEHTIYADKDGVVTHIFYRENQMVEAKKLLVEIT